MRTPLAASLPLTFRQAAKRDVNLIVELINSAYRGEPSRAGWTTEADFLGGQRTDQQQVSDAIRTTGSCILLGTQLDDIVGCLHLQRLGANARLDMFAVKPELQGAGIGKKFLHRAEQFVRQQWRTTAISISVITLRRDLIAFYQRRGYQITPEFEAFPSSERFGIPLVPNLQLVVLKKGLSGIGRI